MDCKPNLFQCCFHSLKSSLYQCLDSNSSPYYLLVLKCVVLKGVAF